MRERAEDSCRPTVEWGGPEQSPQGPKAKAKPDELDVFVHQCTDVCLCLYRRV